MLYPCYAWGESFKPQALHRSSQYRRLDDGRKKYRGKLDRVLETYVNDRLAMFEHIKKDRAFITHSGISKEIESSIYELVKSKGIFDEIYITKASCTISSHCGPNTLGVLFLTE